MAARIPGVTAKQGIVSELHRAARKNFPRRHVTIKGLNDLFQIDLLEMQQFANENNGYKYLLTMIDTFTKRGWALPLKSKKGHEVAEVLDRALASMKTHPKFICSDQGGEFYNTHMSKVLQKYGIRQYSTYSPLKSTIVERYNRTIRNWIEQEFNLNGNYAWLPILDKILHRYNSRVHRSTGFAPLAINKRNEKVVLKRLSKKGIATKKIKFRIGDFVRISKFKNIFSKGYTKSWSTELFIIDEVQITKPVTYKLRDLKGEIIKGGFYQEELQKTNYPNTYLVEKVLQRRGRRVLVKWLGFDDSHNEWIDATEIEK